MHLHDVTEITGHLTRIGHAALRAIIKIDETNSPDQIRKILSDYVESIITQANEVKRIANF